MKNTIKKLTAATLAAALILSLTACGGSSSSYSSSKPKSTPAPTAADKGPMRNGIYEEDVDPSNVAEYLGYTDAIVVDMSNCEMDSIEAKQEYDRNLERQYQEIHDAFLECPKNIILWNMFNPDNIYDQRFMYDIFWLEEIGTASAWIGDATCCVLEMKYTITDKNEILGMQSEIDTAANDILAKCNGQQDIWGNCKIIHDELIRKITYDKSLSHPHIHDLYGALVNGDAVCQGYAYAFSYLTGKLGYNVATIVSDTHGWNWQQDFEAFSGMIDVTWDDPDMKDSAGNDYIMYDYFGVTKEEIERIDAHAIQGMYKNLEVFDVGHQPFNYHEMLGYVMTSYSFDELVRVLSMQDVSNGRLATVKFLNDEAWNDAQVLFENNGELLAEAFSQATGYYGEFTYWYTPELRVIDIAIN